MSRSLETKLIDNLVAILEEEQMLLSAARAAEAAELAGRKLAALQALEQGLQQSPPINSSPRLREGIDYIQRLAQENARFLEAIRHGLQSAITRLEGMNSSVYVGSYSRGGSQMAFRNATGAFNRKA
jgi:flagellar biosynthesis/type III secretory pathway chaperone